MMLLLPRQPPADPTQMCALIEAAIRSLPPTDPADPDEEHLLLLTQGRLSELTGEQSERLLERVAAVPEVAALVADLVRAPIAEAAASSRPRGAGWPRWRITTFSVPVLAACLAIGVGVWQVTAPPIPPSGRGAPRLSFMSVASDPSPRTSPQQYWDERDKASAAATAPSVDSARSPGDTMRNYALYAFAGTSLLLAIPAACWAVGRWKKKPQH